MYTIDKPDTILDPAIQKQLEYLFFLEPKLVSALLNDSNSNKTKTDDVKITEFIRKINKILQNKKTGGRPTRKRLFRQKTRHTVNRL